MVERKLPKLHTRVRFPSPAPTLSKTRFPFGTDLAQKSRLFLCSLMRQCMGGRAVLRDGLDVLCRDVTRTASADILRSSGTTMRNGRSKLIKLLRSAKSLSTWAVAEFFVPG